MVKVTATSNIAVIDIFHQLEYHCGLHLVTCDYETESY